MLTFLQNFARQDSGAVTTDFLVLTAVIVTMGLAGISSISSGTETAAIAVAAGIDTIGEQL